MKINEVQGYAGSQTVTHTQSQQIIKEQGGGRLLPYTNTQALKFVILMLNHALEVPDKLT